MEDTFDHCTLNRVDTPNNYGNVLFEMESFGQKYKLKMFSKLYEDLGKPERILVSNMADAYMEDPKTHKKIDVYKRPIES